LTGSAATTSPDVGGDGAAQSAALGGQPDQLNAVVVVVGLWHIITEGRPPPRMGHDSSAAGNNSGHSTDRSGTKILFQEEALPTQDTRSWRL
jgi:hypothetical protein